jgi:hypothetical protein
MENLGFAKEALASRAIPNARRQQHLKAKLVRRMLRGVHTVCDTVDKKGTNWHLQ